MDYINETTTRKRPLDDGKSKEITLTRCPACINNDLPTGAHKCSECGKNIHVLEECSLSCGDNEGYDEKRMCLSCSKNVNVRNVISEMGYTIGTRENWNKRPKKVKKSKYILKAPNCVLNTNTDKKVKIGFLINGNLSNTVYQIRGRPVALKNTCAFDSIAQV